MTLNCMTYWGALTACVLLWSTTATAARKVYTSVSMFKTALQIALPGDTIELADGKYDISGNSLTKSGTEGLPIVIRAQHRGLAELNGKSSFACKGISYVVIEGFLFTSDVSTVIKTESSNNIRITRNTFRLSETTSAKWVLIGGTYNVATANSHHNRIDHNLFENKKQLGNYVTIDGSPASLGSPEASRYDRIDHNHFRTIGPRAVNEMESIRIGQSEICRSSSYTVIEYNLFEECDGDPEIVSVKTKHSVIRYNTFRRSQGTVCLRSSDSTLVEGNFFFGEGKSGTGGVRMYGTGHQVVNNYFNGLTGDTWDAAVTITNGDVEATGSNTGHWRPQNILVAFNTFKDNANTFQFGFTNGGAYSKPPQNLTVANNIAAGSPHQLVKVITQPGGLVFSGNIMFPSLGCSVGVTVPDSQITSTDPVLLLTDSVWRISLSSPAVNAAAGNFAGIQYDIDGQPRDAVKDVGADELSSAVRINRPLRPEDVGPNGPDSIAVVSTVNVERQSPVLPSEIALFRNYPNPFNPSTIIAFTTHQTGRVVITIYDLLGRTVATVFNGTTEPNITYAVPFNASALSGGMLFAVMDFEQQRFVRKMVLIK